MVLLNSGDLDVNSHMGDNHPTEFIVRSGILNPRLQKIGPKKLSNLRIAGILGKVTYNDVCDSFSGTAKPQRFGQSSGFKTVQGWKFHVI